MHSPPSSKYLKQPVRSTDRYSSEQQSADQQPKARVGPQERDAPSAPNRSYNATLRMLTVDESGLRAQCHLCSARETTSQSARSGMSRSRRYSSTTSLNATVIPPPVSGCRMFHESPRRIAPSFVRRPPCSAEGRKEFGMRRSRSVSSAV